jgi:hypothetical protein
MTGRRWTREDVITALQSLSREGWSPTASEMGAATTNACIRYFGTLRAAARAAGLKPNRIGARPPHLRAPKPKTGPRLVSKAKPRPPAVHVIDPDLAREMAAYLERIRAKYAAEPLTPKRERHRMGQGSDFGGRRWDRTEDYLPPDDLNTSHRRVR